MDDIFSFIIYLIFTLAEFGVFLYGIYYLFKEQLIEKRRFGKDINLFRITLLINFLLNSLVKVIISITVLCKLADSNVKIDTYFLIPVLATGSFSFVNYNITLIVMCLGIINAIKFTKPESLDRLDNNEMREDEYLLAWLLAILFLVFTLLIGFGIGLDVYQDQSTLHELFKVVLAIDKIVYLGTIFGL